MKFRTYTFCLVASLSLMFAKNVEAQQQRIAYVNTDNILSEIPEYENLEEELELMSSQWREELEQMDREIEQLEEDFTSKEVLFTDEIREERLAEIESKKQERDTYEEEKFGPDGEYYTSQQELLEPIQRRVYDAIDEVADREGYDFVFDRAQNASLLFADQAWDINEEVLEVLEIEG